MLEASSFISDQWALVKIKALSGFFLEYAGTMSLSKSMRLHNQRCRGWLLGFFLRNMVCS